MDSLNILGMVGSAALGLGLCGLGSLIGNLSGQPMWGWVCGLSIAIGLISLFVVHGN